VWDTSECLCEWGDKLKKQLFFLFIICLCSLLKSTIWQVKQDGSGDFTTIQEGINSSTDTDTMLVYPGVYLENINYSGKNIAVGSLYLTTGNEQYINQTIIDGNQTGSCVRIISEEDSTTVLCGFTLVNGIGTFDASGISLIGGGIYIKNSQPKILSCIIENNTARSGGGICCVNAHPFLSKTKIINNHALLSGGGLSLVQGSDMTFDQENLCDIYLNFAGGASEIFKNDSCPELYVYVDTFTVMEPDYYFIYTTTSNSTPLNDIYMNIQNAKLEPVDSDLFVSPDGDNTNSGLSADDPLKTVNFASSLIKSDSLNPHSIHLANGIYSKTESEQCLPYNIRGYISLIGEDMENTLIDAESVGNHIRSFGGLNFTLKNLSFMNGNGTYMGSSCMGITAIDENKYVNLENICISDFDFSYDRILELHQLDVNMKNVTVKNNHNTTLRVFNSIWSGEVKIKIENSVFSNNTQDPTSSDSFHQIDTGLCSGGTLRMDIINSAFTDNYCYSSSYPVRSSGINVWYDIYLNIINCTVGNNVSPNSGGVIVLKDDSSGSIVNIYNSILYGDIPGEIYVNNAIPTVPCEVNIVHSLVDGGLDGIYNPNWYNSVNWLQGNLDENPMFDSLGTYPFALSAYSPCINAGTLDLPAGIELPQYDLAGNPRIYGDNIDMGAYEWQGVGVEEPEIPQISPLTTNISNYPNPFNPSTTIKLELAEAGKIELAIYNIKGQKVKTLMDAYTGKGIFEVNWNGKDEMGKSVSSGQYLIKLKQNGIETTSKIMLLK